ncbi:VOC family protein [Amycolatopsis plumensis]|uniref:VOC family protein n=1 Tax=Amycolatopsis plumensis TaxID=236508 RepID=UPI003615F546
MIKLYDIDHVVMGVKDLDESVESWQNEFGLTEVSREGSQSFLVCNYEKPSLILQKTPEAGILHAAYQLAPELTLDDAEKHLKEKRVQFTGPRPRSPSRTSRQRHPVRELPPKEGQDKFPPSGARPRKATASGRRAN